MITDMVNLGPPKVASTDPKVNSRKGNPLKDEVGSTPGSFERVMNNVQQESRPTEKTDEVKLPLKSDSSESQIENKIQTNGSVKNKNLSERQKVMQQFMDSMESEFGIPPQRIMEAMAQLSDEQLLQSPEETTSQVISDLPLDPEQTEKAEAMYLAMLAQLSGTLPQVRDPEPLTPQQKMLAGALVAGTGTLLSSQDRRIAINKALDDMNNKFFMRPLPVTEAPLAGGSEYQQAATEIIDPEMTKGLETSQPQLYSNRKGIDLRNFEKYEQIKSIPIQNSPSVSAIPQEQPVSVPKEMTKVEAEESLLKSLAALGVAAGALSEVASAADDTAVESGKATLASSDVSNEMAIEGLISKPQIEDTDTKDMKFSSDGEEKNSHQQFELKSLPSAVKTENAEFFPSPQVSPENLNKLNSARQVDVPPIVTAQNFEADTKSDVNIKQIMNQAKYVIKNGGGEAIVKMNPEGLGEVRMKVLVNQGRVDVQMFAENNEVKKLIESNISDLKTSLQAHKLSIDHVKVDVGNQLASQNDNSNNSSQNRQDQYREQARQFMGQFRDENFSRRDSFYEMPGIKAYGANRNNPDPLPPSGAVKSAGLRRYQGSGKGTGLDLVA